MNRMLICLVCKSAFHAAWDGDPVCPSCLDKIRLADAVLAMPKQSSLWRCEDGWRYGFCPPGDTPLEALEAAGVKG